MTQEQMTTPDQWPTDPSFPPMDETTISYGGKDAGARRELASGQYAVMIQDAKKAIQKFGKYKGNGSVDWTFIIIEGPLKKLRMIASTLLQPEEMRWLTDLVLSSVRLGLKPGDPVDLRETIGKTLEVQIDTLTRKSGGVSMYVRLKGARPYAAADSVGPLTDFADFDKKTELPPEDESNTIPF